MTLREVERIQGDKIALDQYVEGMAKLFGCGVIDALRALGRPQRFALGRDPNVMASEASYSSGWNDCLDALLYFKERFINITEVKPALRMDYSSLENSVLNGDLTKEEADAIRTGEPVKYDSTKLTGNVPNYAELKATRNPTKK